MKNDAAKFWSLLSKTNPGGCWEWTQSIQNYGYGLFKLNGKLRSTHRVAWELTHGPIPSGLCVLHRCDNPPCCNPDHLFLGTAKTNAMDKMNKGRGLKGTKHPISKLADSDILQIRKLATSGSSHRRLAALFNVHRSNIGYIVRRKTWTHL